MYVNCTMYILAYNCFEKDNNNAFKPKISFGGIHKGLWEVEKHVSNISEVWISIVYQYYIIGHLQQAFLFHKNCCDAKIDDCKYIYLIKILKLKVNILLSKYYAIKCLLFFKVFKHLMKIFLL